MEPWETWGADRCFCRMLLLRESRCRPPPVRDTVYDFGRLNEIAVDQ